MSGEPKGPFEPTVQYAAGRCRELLDPLHPDDKALVLENLGLQEGSAPVAKAVVIDIPETSRKK